MKICSIDGCGLKHKAYGRCVKHHLRWKKHGDPTIGAEKTPKGLPKRWLAEHINYSGDECLIWPFSKMTNGYAWIWWNNRGTGGHRIMCEMAHGHAPSKSHQAAHSCGNGRGACVNPNHLRWATRIQNDADKDVHGTRVYGSKIKWSKLTESDVARICVLLKTRTDAEIAEDFNVSDTAIYAIRIGRNWKRAA